MTKKYTQDGVNVAEGDSFSAFAGKLCRGTYGNSPYVEVRDFSSGHFRGPRGYRLKGLPNDFWMDAAPDGDGTKTVLVDASGNYEDAACGFVAMTCGDITRWGGIPLLVVNNFDVRTIGETGSQTNNACRTMMGGLQRICDAQKLVMFKGETAELGRCVGTENPDALVTYLWSGVALGAYDPRRVITGDSVKEGMVVIALKEEGFRNNGISSVRRALAMRFGEYYFTNPAAEESVHQAAEPAVLYDLFLSTLNGWFNPEFQPIVSAHLIVHVTGGAIRSKLAEDILFPRGLSVILDDLWEPPEIMQRCAEWRGMSDEECYEVWNGGQGVLMVVNRADVETCIDCAARYDIQAKVAGRITREASGRPKAVIHSKYHSQEIVFSAS